MTRKLVSRRRQPRLLNLLSIAFILICASTMCLAFDSKPLRPFNAEFTAYRSGNDVGIASMSLKSLENHRFKLDYNSRVSRFFISDKRSETTIFNVEQDKLIPLSYDYKRTGTGPNKALSLSFSPEEKSITVDEKTSIEWLGEFDNQLFRIDLPRRLARGEKSVIYDFYNYRGEKRQYIMDVMAKDNLSLPYGQLTAYKVKIKRKSNSRITFAWFAPSLNHNLVRLQQFKDGEEQGDMQLKDFQYQ